MAKFIIEAKSNIQSRDGNLDTGIINQRESRTIDLSACGVTQTNLFSEGRFRCVLADQLNKAFGVSIFTKDNIREFGTSFNVKSL